MSWQFPKWENPDAYRVQRLQLVEQPALDFREDGKNSRERRAELWRSRIMFHLRSCEMPCTLESIAEACKVPKVTVRMLVKELKRTSGLVEAANSHVLLKIKFDE